MTISSYQQKKTRLYSKQKNKKKNAQMHKVLQFFFYEFSYFESLQTLYIS